jgi:hypothetical protein
VLPPTPLVPEMRPRVPPVVTPDLEPAALMTWGRHAVTYDAGVQRSGLDSQIPVLPGICLTCPPICWAHLPAKQIALDYLQPWELELVEEDYPNLTHV